MNTHKEPAGGPEALVILRIAIGNLWSKLNVQIVICISRLANTKKPETEELNLNALRNRQRNIFLVGRWICVESRRPDIRSTVTGIDPNIDLNSNRRSGNEQNKDRN